jgi:hypothetical protein
MSAEQQVITIDDISADNAPTIYVTGGLGQFFSAVEKEVTAEVPDLSTRKGRERIASLAAKVSKSKSAVEKPGRDYLKRLKEMPKVVETELREFVTKMDALRDATRQPLTEWEKAEDARVDKHNDGIQQIKDLAVFTETPTAAHVAQVISDLELVAIDESWQEFLPEAAQVKDKSLASLRTLLADRTKHEAELAEIAKFNAEKAEREQQERDAAIARAAVEKAQREAAEAAQAERDAAARREQALIDQAAQAQRDADQKIRDAEAAASNQALQLQLAAEKAERQKVQAEADRVAAIQSAERERIASEQRQAAAVEQARLAEVARANAAADEINRQAAAREADKAHKGAIYKAAKEAFIANGMSEECARLAVKVIASGFIPAISITY